MREGWRAWKAAAGLALALAGARGQTVDIQPQPMLAAHEVPLVLRAGADLGPGAKKEVSGIVRSRREKGIFWTVNDSGDEPRIYPVRADGSLVQSVRYPEEPGTLIGGAIDGDWEDIALDASGRVIIGDIGNNSNARADLALYFVEEPEPTEGRTTWTSKVLVRYPDQKARPAPEEDFNFDAEAMFTVGDEVYILSKNRSDSFTKLYHVADRAPGVVNTLRYMDRFDVLGQATAADATDDGLRLAVLTYERIWIFERATTRDSFFSGRVYARAYRYDDGDSDSEAICWEDDQTLLIADEARGKLFRAKTADVPLVREAIAPGSAGSEPESELDFMSFNIRYAGADDGANAWAHRKALVERVIRESGADVIGLQEVEAVQADWLRATFPGYGFHGVGRIDGAREGEFAPVMWNANRFTLLAGGYFWISPTPDLPGSKGWDAACERMASWVRLYDRREKRALVVVNTHLDHVGEEARERGYAMIVTRAEELALGAPVVVMGDFNMPASSRARIETSTNRPTRGVGSPSDKSLLDGLVFEDPPWLRRPQPSTFVDAFEQVHRVRDGDEATFCGWDGRIMGERIDWILTSPELVVLDASIERLMPGGRCPSDHYPVKARARYETDDEARTRVVNMLDRIGGR